VIGTVERLVEELVQILRSRLFGGVARFPVVRDEFAQFGHIMRVEMLGHLIGPVPVGVVGPHHRDTVAGAAAFVVPDLVPGEVDGVAELHGIQQGLGGFVQARPGLANFSWRDRSGRRTGVEGVGEVLVVTVQADVHHGSSGGVCHGTSLVGRPSLASATSGRTEISGRLFRKMRKPTSWVYRWFFCRAHVAGSAGGGGPL